MDFSFVNSLISQLENNNIFNYSFTGAKILAFALLMFKVLELFVKDFEGKDPKMGNILTLFGYGLIIMSSDWIMTSIENIFATVEVTMGKTSSNTYTTLNTEVSNRLSDMFAGAKDFLDYVGIFFGSFITVISLLVTWILGGLCKLADLSITTSYLVQRMFIIKLLQFLFPLAVALSTYSGTSKLFSGWILRYIGVFILGIAYIGIIKITDIFASVLLQQFHTGGASQEWVGNMAGNAVEGGFFATGILVTMIVSFTVKIKLFSTVTSYVSGMFQ